MDGTPAPVALLNGWFFTALAKSTMGGLLPGQVPPANLSPLDFFPDPKGGADAGVAVIVLNSLATPLTLIGMYQDDGMVTAKPKQSSYPATICTNGITKYPHTIPGIRGYPIPSAHPLPVAGFGPDLMAGVGIYRFHCPTNDISYDGMGFALGFSCNHEDYPNVGIAFRKNRESVQLVPDPKLWTDGQTYKGVTAYWDPKDSFKPSNTQVSGLTWNLVSKVSADISKVTDLVDPNKPNAALATGVNVTDRLKKLWSRISARYHNETVGGGKQVVYSPFPIPNAAEANGYDVAQLPDGHTLFIRGNISFSPSQRSMNVITIWVGDTKSWLNDIQGEMANFHWGNTLRRVDQSAPLLMWVDFASGGKNIGAFIRRGPKWQEVHTDGFTTWFDEASSDKSSVHLSDASRGVTVTIDLTGGKIRYREGQNAEYDLYDILTVRQIPL